MGLSLAERSLDRFVRASRRANSSALLVAADGRTLAGYRDPSEEPLIPIMSITKTITALLLGMLIDDRAIVSEDMALGDLLPIGDAPFDRTITLRHVISHTSGLERVYRPDDWGVPGPLSPANFRSAGSKFEYSNEAFQLLAPICVALTGRSFEDFAAERLFAPLGIAEWRWERDRRGEPTLGYGLSLTDDDLARIGHMMLDQGSFAGRQIISEEWVLRSTRLALPRAPNYGYGWWLRRHGERSEAGQRYRGFYAHGWLGQVLAVYPAARLVCVRLYRQREKSDDSENRTSGFAEIFDLLEACF